MPHQKTVKPPRARATPSRVVDIDHEDVAAAGDATGISTDVDGAAPVVLVPTAVGVALLDAADPPEVAVDEAVAAALVLDSGMDSEASDEEIGSEPLALAAVVVVLVLGSSVGSEASDVAAVDDV